MFRTEYPVLYLSETLISDSQWTPHCFDVGWNAPMKLLHLYFQLYQDLDNFLFLCFKINNGFADDFCFHATSPSGHRYLFHSDVILLLFSQLSTGFKGNKPFLPGCYYYWAWFWKVGTENIFYFFLPLSPRFIFWNYYFQAHTFPPSRMFQSFRTLLLFLY